jgi:hypothetical protein
VRNPLDNAVTRTLATLGAARANMLVITAAYGIFAVSLTAEPARWAATPAYANLLAIMPQRDWGAAFAVTAVMLAAAVRLWSRHWLSVTALSVALAITTTWLAAFVIRWLTSGNTTPETWVSWAIFDYLLVRALLLLGYKEGGHPAEGRRD